MRLELDRIAVEEAGANAQRLAAAIHAQLPDLVLPVPIETIARALGIEEIRIEPLQGFEAALVTTPEKGRGSILVNANSSYRRQRYSIGHELGHFLNPWHQPLQAQGFYCKRADMVVADGKSRHLRQEAEANRFAIELLAPRRMLKHHLTRTAGLEHALAMARELEISKAAATRRYVELHDECLAVVFSHHRRVLYIHRPRSFPRTRIWNGDQLPTLGRHANDVLPLTGLDEVSAGVWLEQSDDITLYAQTHHQAEGHAITLLLAETDTEDL